MPPVWKGSGETLQRPFRLLATSQLGVEEARRWTGVKTTIIWGHLEEDHSCAEPSLTEPYHGQSTLGIKPAAIYRLGRAGTLQEVKCHGEIHWRRQGGRIKIALAG